MHDSPALEGCNNDLNLRCLLWFSVSSPVLASCAWWFMIIASFNGCSHVVLTELCHSWGCKTLQREFSGYDRGKIRAVQMACLDGCTQFLFWDITSIMRIETQLCTKRYCLQGTLSLSSYSFLLDDKGYNPSIGKILLLWVYPYRGLIPSSRLKEFNIINCFSPGFPRVCNCLESQDFPSAFTKGQCFSALKRLKTGLLLSWAVTIRHQTVRTLKSRLKQIKCNRSFLWESWSDCVYLTRKWYFMLHQGQRQNFHGISTVWKHPWSWTLKTW